VAPAVAAAVAAAGVAGAAVAAVAWGRRLIGPLICYSGLWRRWHRDLD
jgi:hypothetical protein